MKEGSSLRTFWTYGVALALVHLAAACSPATPDPQPSATPTATAATPAADGKSVVVFGDSLFAGYNLPQDKGFAPALQRALAAQGVKAAVFNAGVSGDTSAAGLQRLAFTLDGQPRKPDLVIVGLGANDMLRGLNPADTRRNLDSILAELKKREIPAMLTGMVASPNMGADYARQFNAIYPDLARQYDVPLYPFFLDGVITDRALLLPDGIHPNEKGVERITAAVVRVVAARLAK
ncbi:arylesterase [Sphingomonas sp. MG17]|uniref:Arylesterase n=1 Tax=Sphingomonas tagetis TaxID=2949092 RepID=A0A9X2HIY3_9SPHN|nr:arylesterase [Sphingomonas tagetis]MCP3728824.1 arylesterase [Sphingomonas tagetis]